MTRITVGGLPGSGTSTLCRALAGHLGLPYVYAGRIFRDEAERRGMDLASFGRLCEEDPSIDRALDDRQVEMLHGRDDLLLEGRLAGWLAHREGIAAMKVWIACAEKERHRRLAQREGSRPDHEAEKAREREASERGRYRRYYDIDLEDLSVYDLVLDSTTTEPERLVEQVVDHVETTAGP